MPGQLPALSHSAPPCPVRFGIARSLRERRAAATLAHRIYCEEHLDQPWATGRRHFADDPYGPSAQVLVARHAGEVVCTVAIHHPDPGRARDRGTTFGLPIETTLDLSGLTGRPVLQVSHAACAPSWRGHGLSRALWARVLQQTRHHELLVMAATGLSTQADAAALWAELQDSALPVRLPHWPGVVGSGSGAPGSAVPWLIQSYQRQGLLAAGEPVWFPRFGMYDLPMWMPQRASA